MTSQVQWTVQDTPKKRPDAANPAFVQGGTDTRAFTWPPMLFGAMALAIALSGLVLLLLNWNAPKSDRWGFWGFQSLMAVMTTVTGLLITRRYPRHPIGWMMLMAGLFAALTGFSEEFAVYAVHVQPELIETGTLIAGLLHWLWIPSYALISVFLPLLFPNGRFLSPRWRMVAWLGAFWMIVSSAFLFLFPGPLPNNADITNPFGLSAWEGTALVSVEPRITIPMTGMILMLAAAASIILRYRRWQDPVTRQQLKWYAYAAVLGAFAGMVGQLSGPLPGILLFLMTTALPVSIAVAILRYRLYDIDLLINRTLVCGALTAIVVGVYALTVAAAGALAQTWGDWSAALIAIALVAILFHPLRVRLQRGVNRLLYGQRDAPLAVLSQLGQRMESAVSPEEMMSILTETVAKALKLPYVAVKLQSGDDLTTASEYGRPIQEVMAFPLTHQGKTVGRLLAAPRQPGDALNRTDIALLENVARQAGAAAHAAQLTADLRHSRQRLIAAREEERRRLRRDLHDDLGPKLASLTLSLDALGRLMSSDPAAAAALLAELKEQAGSAVQDIRRLARDLRPPTLDDLGLVAALRERAARYRQSGVRIAVHASEAMPDLPAAVEVAAYRIAQEAMTNIVRHAQATSCRVTLELKPGALLLTAEDDGRGLPAYVQPGIGLRSMRERAAELEGRFSIQSRPGSGTTMRVMLPLRNPL